jgi:hypothetical protein
VVGKGGHVRLLRRHPGGHGSCSRGGFGGRIVASESFKGGGSGGGGNIDGLDACGSWSFATGPWGREVHRQDRGVVVGVDGRIWLGLMH